MKHPRTSALWPALLWLAALAAPSDAAVSIQAPGPASWSSATGVAATPQGAIAEGPSWQARFGPGGFVLRTPGARVEDEPPAARFALRSIRRGGTPWITPRGAARPVVEGKAVLYAHERGVLERYDVRQEGLEQSFVFPTRPPGAGDLVVELTLETDLQPQELPGGAGARLLGQGGGLAIGTVRGLDAEGRSVPGTVRLVEGGVELVLPEAFVRDAPLPLVLDPLLGPAFEVAPGSWFDVAQDAAHANIGRDVWIVLWRRVFGGADTDLRAQRFEADGTPLGGMLFVTNDIDRDQRDAAIDESSASFSLAVWSERPSAGGDADILCRSIGMTDGRLSNVVPVAQTSADEAEPAVGCFGPNLQNGQRSFLVPYVVDDQRVLATRVTASFLIEPYLSSAPVVLHDVAVHGGDRVGAPAVNRELSWQWAVVFEVHFPSPSPGDNDVFGALVEFATMAVTRFPLAGAVGEEEGHPVIAGDGLSSFLVVWHHDDRSQGSTSRDVRGIPVDATSGVPILGAPFDISAVPGRDEANPTVATGGEKAYVIWSESPTATVREVHALGLCGDTFTVCEPRQPLFAAPSTYFLSPVVAGGDFSVKVNPFLVIATEQDALFTTAKVQAQPMIEFGGGAVVDEGGACGGGGTLALSGPAAVGNSSLAVDLTGADPTRPAGILLLRFSSPSLVSCGPCQVDLSPGPNFALPLAGGSASLALPVPPDPLLVGASGSVQALVLGSPGSCSKYPKLSASNRLRMTLAY